MANTTNFNWETPDDTDLVKDGAAAIRTLGSSIDTSFVDLKGGTTGQILSKASNTDLDYTWIANDQGDITEVQAGTGISVASGTGPIPVVTNTVATAFDAKGDLIGGTGADTFSRLAVGANNTVLTADSSAATGLKWAAPSSPNFVGAQADFGQGTTVSYTQSANLILAFPNENYDTDGFHSTSSNTSRMTIPAGKAGYYIIACNGVFLGTIPGYARVLLYKNGSQLGEDPLYGGRLAEYTVNSNVSLNGQVIMYGAVGDYFEIAYTGDLGTGSKTALGSFTLAYLGA
jgi:hypothetical protein